MDSLDNFERFVHNEKHKQPILVEGGRALPPRRAAICKISLGLFFGERRPVLLEIPSLVGCAHGGQCEVRAELGQRRLLSMRRGLR